MSGHAGQSVKKASFCALDLDVSQGNIKDFVKGRGKSRRQRHRGRAEGVEGVWGGARPSPESFGIFFLKCYILVKFYALLDEIKICNRLTVITK